MKQCSQNFPVLLLGISLLMVSMSSLGADLQKGLDAYKRGDYQAALREWRPLAEQGHARGQKNLGVMYEFGRGVEQSLTEAVKWYRLAAEQGDAEGQTSLGVMYYNGAGIDRSFTEAVKWYRLAAEQGHARGQKNLGVMYEYGRGVDRSLTEAVKLYRLAAEQGDAEGQTSLGVMYEYGRGVDRSFTKAVSLYRLAAEQAHARGQQYLGTMYEFGKGVEQSLTEAVKWYQLAAEQGDAEGQTSLGVMYEHGRGVDRSLTEAVKLYRLAAEQGRARGQKNLGVMYEFGRGVDRSLTEAVKWYRLAAEQGHARGQKNLGTMYEYGRGVDRSLTEAVKLYRLAAEQGDPEGQTSLGVMYEHGRGVDRSFTKAVKWYRLAAEQGRARGQKNLGVMYEFGRGVDRSLTEAVKWYRLAAEQNNELAIDRLKELGIGRIPSQGWEDSPREAAQSIETDKELEELRERLALLEAQTKQSKQAISTDNSPPSIRITEATAQGLRARISAQVMDNVSVAEVTLNGSLPLKIDGSAYYWEIFIPSDGLSVLIEAVDQRGLMSRKSTRIEREKTSETVIRLAAVNPLVGPKQKTSRDRVALIIGVEKYARAPSADYASGDANMFADYAREKLGIPDNNIKVLGNIGASKAEILRALKVWLPKAVKPEKTDLYVFYAGHGMPNADGSSAYLIPYDGDIQLLEDTAISRKRFFDEISATKPRSAIFFFDNCFSGATRSEELLLASRPLGIKVQETSIPDNYLVFTAGETDQIAGVEPEVKHGRFSYFVFKGLEGEADANQDGKISAGELHAYVSESVWRFSAGAQTPTMFGNTGRWVVN